jgi:TolB protein
MDFNKIVYICGATVNNDICVINSDGTGLKNLTEKINDISLTDGASAWSPDGKKIVFDAFSPDHLQEGIAVINVDGTGFKLLTNSFFMELPLWSQDGTMIAMYGYPDGDAEVYVMNPDGTGFRDISNSPNNDYFPVWRP